jgi:hypothetical protein
MQVSFIFKTKQTKKHKLKDSFSPHYLIAYKKAMLFLEGEGLDNPDL